MTVREDCAVKEVKEGKVVTLTGEDVAFDECLWCTQAGAPDWLKATGLPLGNMLKCTVFRLELISHTRIEPAARSASVDSHFSASPHKPSRGTLQVAHCSCMSVRDLWRILTTRE